MKKVSLNDNNSEVYLLPTSYGQERIWFFEKLVPNSATYNIPFIYKIKGNLNRFVLEQTIGEIMQRHEVFRTTFCEVEGAPVQRVSPHSSPFTLQTNKVEEIEEKIEFTEYLNHFARQSFDLNKGPLIKFELIEMDNHLHFLLINVHHIIFDAWSMDILKKELLTLYSVYEKGEQSSISDLEFHYADFAQWEKDLIEEVEDTKKLEFWNDYLKDAPSLLELSTDYPRPKTPSYKGDNNKFGIPKELVERVRVFVQSKGYTLNAFYMSVFNILLYRYTGQKDVVIGTPISNRKEYFTQNLIGFFVNTIPVRTQIRPYSNFANVLKGTVKSFLQSYENSNVPFERIVQEMNPERESAHHPIFQVLFTYHEQQQEDIQGNTSLVIEQDKINTNTSKFDLVFYISTGLKQGNVDIEYNSDLFHHKTIERFGQHYLKLISEILDNPDKHVFKHTFLTKQEQKDLQFSQDGLTSNRYIHERFEQQVTRKGQTVAVKGAYHSYTYEELNIRANQVANAIQKSEIPFGSTIGIRMKRSPEQIAAILGVIKSGCVYLPIDPGLPMNRVNYMLGDSKASILLMDEYLETETMVTHAMNLDEVFKFGDETSPQWEVNATAKDLLAYVIYTSGSTGKPKGVSISHTSLLNHIDAYLDAFPFEEGERMLQNITFSFDASITEIFGSILGGATLVLTNQENQFDVDYLADLISNQSVTRAQLFHSLIEKLVDIPSFKQTKKLRSVFTGGEALNQNLVDTFYASMEHDVKLINLYGPTEATVATTFHVCQKGGHLPSVPIGRPFNGYKLRVLDEYFQPVPKGVEGELFIGGAGVAKEYLNNEEGTNSAFPLLKIGEKKERFYRTGDIVKQIEDGSFRFISRKDTQVKIRGFRIELNEIKNVLLGIAGIEQAAVIVKEHRGEKKLFCFLVKSEMSMTAKSVKGMLIQELPHYMVPSGIVFVNEIPVSTNGKLLKEELPYHLNDLVSEKKVLFRSEMEKRLCSIWEKILGTSPIGINEDFFDLGGHSIKAIEVVGAIRKSLSRDIPLSILFEYRTIELLSEWLEGQSEDIKRGLVFPLKEAKKEGHPLFLVHPGGGGALCYMQLARAIEIQGDIYGIQSVGYEKGENPLHDIRAMAKRYVEEIKKFQPKGPYQLAGWSMGGTLAVEMGRILEDAGEFVSFLGLLDAYPFHQLSDQVEQRNPLSVWAHTLGLELTAFEELSDEKKYELVLEGAKERGKLPQDAEMEDVKRIIAVMGANNLACAQYRFEEPIQSDLYLFHCAELDPVHPHLLINEVDWRIRTKGILNSIEIRGHHNNIMESSQVESLGLKISRIITGKEGFSFECHRESEETTTRDTREIDTVSAI